MVSLIIQVFMQFAKLVLYCAINFVVLPLERESWKENYSTCFPHQICREYDDWVLTTHISFRLPFCGIKIKFSNLHLS